jgi:hypothetical protein
MSSFRDRCGKEMAPHAILGFERYRGYGGKVNKGGICGWMDGWRRGYACMHGRCQLRAAALGGVKLWGLGRFGTYGI